MPDDHRTYGETRDCRGCRYWSELITKWESGDPDVVAYCLAPGGPVNVRGYTSREGAGLYTAGAASCDAWASGHHGPIDQPGENEEIRALYAEEAADA